MQNGRKVLELFKRSLNIVIIRMPHDVCIKLAKINRAHIRLSKLLNTHTRAPMWVEVRKSLQIKGSCLEAASVGQLRFYLRGHVP